MRLIQTLSVACLISMSIWCVLWEGYLTTNVGNGSWMTIKSIPIILPLFGVLRNKLKAYQYAVLLVFPYFIEGTVRTYADTGVDYTMAVGELTLSLLTFVTLLYSVKKIKKHHQ